jgi:hypothetical protein
MRKFLFVSIVLCFISAEKPLKLPRKLWGNYYGISAHSIMVIRGNDSTFIESTPLQLVIEKDKLYFNIGEDSFDAEYTVLAITNTDYSISANFQIPLGSCNFSLSKKNKKIIWKREFESENEILLKK